MTSWNFPAPNRIFIHSSEQWRVKLILKEPHLRLVSLFTAQDINKVVNIPAVPNSSDLISFSSYHKHWSINRPKALRRYPLWSEASRRHITWSEKEYRAAEQVLSLHLSSSNLLNKVTNHSSCIDQTPPSGSECLSFEPSYNIDLSF